MAWAIALSRLPSMSNYKPSPRLTLHTLFVPKANYFVFEYPQSTVLILESLKFHVAVQKSRQELR
jgi:hypothetical protein